MRKKQPLSTHAAWRVLVETDGLDVSREWRASFRAFIEDMGFKPPGHVISRISDAAGYGPGNCVWVPAERSARISKRSLVKSARLVSMTQTPPVRQFSCSPAVPKFLQILLAERDRLKGFARLLTRDSDAAADLVQETIIRAWHAREQFSGEGLRPWLNTILRNKYFGDLRKQRNANDFAQLLGSEESVVKCHGAAACDAEVLAVRFSELPQGQRDVILGLSSGETYEAVAARLNINIGTVKSRASRAREALQS